MEICNLYTFMYLTFEKESHLVQNIATELGLTEMANRCMLVLLK